MSIYRGYLVRFDHDTQDWSINRHNGIVGRGATECDCRTQIDMRFFTWKDLKPEFDGEDAIGWYRADHVDAAVMQLRRENDHLLRVISRLSSDEGWAMHHLSKKLMQQVKDLEAKHRGDESEERGAEHG